MNDSEDLTLYRELGTPEQLARATDAVDEARQLRARVAELETQLQKTRNSWAVQQDLLQDACNAHAQAAHDRDHCRAVLVQIKDAVLEDSTIGIVNLINETIK
jgi:hypothetical protein